MPLPTAGMEILATVRSGLTSTLAGPSKRSVRVRAARLSLAMPAATRAAVTSRALTTTVAGWLSLGNAAWMRSYVRITCRSRGNVSKPGTAVWMRSAGTASATSRPLEMSTETSGRVSTTSTTRDHGEACASRPLSRPTNGRWPLSTRSPSHERTAGRTVTEPIIETATTTIVPVANDANVGAPPRYMPAIAMMTVNPDISTARPEVAAAASSAAASLRPAARSSRSRRR